MSELAKRAGLEYVSKSHMFDLKKAFAEKVRPVRPGDEARIVNWALAEERKAEKITVSSKGQKRRRPQRASDD